MREVDDFRDEIELTFAEAAREMAELPVEIRETGQYLLSRCNPLRSGGKAKAISFLQPYWLQEETDAPVELCRDLAIGSLYVMLHYFVLDDAMDGGEGRAPSASPRKLLALGQMLQVLYRQRYARYFAHDSLLWAYDRKYIEQWSSAVNREVLEPVDPLDYMQLAGKAAPVKLGAAGVLIWSGQTERIAETEEAIDLALAVLQLSDDWADWLEDLPEANRNAFLTLVRDKQAGSAEADGPLDEQSVKRAIYRQGAVLRLAEIAAGYGERLRRIPIAPRRVIAFQGAIELELQDAADQIEQAVDGLAAHGGISQLLSNFMKS